ncbi:MAG TPA: serine/threonine-protein kinase [Kofleriaceae bacterium]|nr:serine/threonine-protein kinase [Kofleriaceae bacterium]
MPGAGDKRTPPRGAGTRPAATKLGVIAARTSSPTPPDRHAHLIGEVVLDRYRIESRLGAGATGTVFRGRHVKLGRGVAIKVLHEDFAEHPTMLARFRREAEAAGRLRHPNLSGVLDIGETASGHPLMVMELVEGPSLRAVMDDALASGELLPSGRVIHLIRHILRGLDHAHVAGLVHRDLKPDNVLVERDAHGAELPRIVDFGIAALTTDEAISGGRLTETGVLLGTPLYMAPEQARGDRLDGRADLFALGIMVFELASGTTPFDGSALEIVIANMNEDVPAIAHRAPGARPDPVLELFLRRLVARDPAGRFATAHDALAMLDAVEADPADAAVRLGRTDVHRALAVIALPRP